MPKLAMLWCLARFHGVRFYCYHYWAMPSSTMRVMCNVIKRQHNLLCSLTAACPLHLPVPFTFPICAHVVRFSRHGWAMLRSIICAIIKCQYKLLCSPTAACPLHLPVTCTLTMPQAYMLHTIISKIQT